MKWWKFKSYFKNECICIISTNTNLVGKLSWPC